MNDFDPSLDELVSAYVDDAATPEERARVEADPALLARVDVFRSLAAATRAPVDPDPARRDAAIAAALAAASFVGADQLDDASPAPGPANVSTLRSTERSRRPILQRWDVIGKAAAVVAVLALAVGALATLTTPTDDDDTAAVGDAAVEDQLDEGREADRADDANEAEAPAPADSGSGGGAAADGAGEEAPADDGGAEEAAADDGAADDAADGATDDGSGNDAAGDDGAIAEPDEEAPQDAGTGGDTFDPLAPPLATGVTDLAEPVVALGPVDTLARFDRTADVVADLAAQGDLADTLGSLPGTAGPLACLTDARLESTEPFLVVVVADVADRRIERYVAPSIRFTYEVDGARCSLR